MNTLPVGPAALQVGDLMPDDVVGPLTRTDFVRYAGAGGDLNPIHHDEEFARNAGLPSVFGMGMLGAGMLGNRVARWVGPRNIEELTVRFTGQVWPGDVLSFHGQVEEITDSVATIALSVANKREETVLRASAKARVRPETRSG
jgi:acyl dehydratase